MAYVTGGWNYGKEAPENKKWVPGEGGPNKISEPEALFIKAGLKDLDEGRTHSHEEVMREVREKYKL